MVRVTVNDAVADGVNPVVTVMEGLAEGEPDIVREEDLDGLAVGVSPLVTVID